jgi:hypothetical protein
MGQWLFTPAIKIIMASDLLVWNVCFSRMRYEDYVVRGCMNVIMDSYFGIIYDIFNGVETAKKARFLLLLSPLG